MLLKAFRLVALTALPALLAAGCESAAETAEPPPRLPATDSRDPLAEIPREELYGAGPADNLWSPRFELEILNLPPGWDGSRIAIVSDLQLGRWEENETVATAAVQRALQLQPDIIALMGDFVAEGADPQVLERVLAPLRGRRAVAVLGSQDVRSDSVEAQVTLALQAVGVQVLSNSSVALEIRGDTAWIGGLDPSLLRTNFGDQQWILSTLGETGRTPIVLTHNSALATRAPMGRFPIFIGGNTFCGDVEVPGTPRLSWLRDEIFPQGRIEGRDRLFRVQGGTLVAMCGTGYGFVPVRFGAPPEVPLLTLRRVGPAAPRQEQGVVADTMIERFQREPAAEQTQPPNP